MSTAYTVVTLVTAFFTGSAAVFYLIGHEYPKSQADMKRIPRRYVPVLGSLLAAGTAGLLIGFAVPLLGTLAAAGLVLYFTGALVAHLRVGSRNLVGWAIFFVTVVADLVVNLLHHY
ncbi:DoxX family protein [Actinoplanes xinjiangensis]|uniref:DoxX-like protein n=1 Tax=Actinoplanes xinjiangensis TaxID=512350 RepID=A0A316F7A3_9ACTN|nr:DoxX family protein [Actinoplanes xinjiangensis]PWK40135.1 DoxX-like protein [Actinoplanes xinjiangensis]GIF42450.1 membrane protein [Actinoplanes xinjiangensis]